MIDDLIKALEGKGLNDARSVVKELLEGGALTGYAASKYLAREKVIVAVCSSCTTTTRIIEDAAFEYSISKKTLQDNVLR